MYVISEQIKIQRNLEVFRKYSIFENWHLLMNILTVPNTVVLTRRSFRKNDRFEL